MNDWINNYINDQKKLLELIPVDQIKSIIHILAKALDENRQIFVFGNGGSATNSSHFVTDLGKCASDALNKRFRCHSLNENVSWMTAVGNDDAYEDVYVRQLENYATQEDIAIAFSVSGSSPNLVKAFKWANEHGLYTIALTGGKKGLLAGIAQQTIFITSDHYGHVEDMHMMIAHIICYSFIENPEIEIRR